jgi:CrcB protein
VTALWVVLGACAGAPARYLVDVTLQGRSRRTFPWGILTVNVVGAFLLGLLVGLDVGENVMAALGTGFCGAFTTYSAFAYETTRLAGDGARTVAVVNVVATLGLGLAAAVGGWLVGSGPA